MTEGNCYDTLGLPPDATPAEIREAYARLAEAHFPGRRASYSCRLEAKQAIVALMAAYETLADPKQRAEHDWRLGIDDLQPLDWGGAIPEPHPVDLPVAPALGRLPFTLREWRCALKLLRRTARR